MNTDKDSSNISSSSTIPQSIDFFKLKEYFYTNSQAWKQIPNNVKAKNAFMLMRNVAIAYPQVVQILNKMGMNQVAALNVMQSWLCDSRQPKWSFTSGKKGDGFKTQSDTQQAIEKFDADVVYEYRKMHDMDRKLFEDFVKFVPDQVLSELNELKQQMQGVTRH